MKKTIIWVMCAVSMLAGPARAEALSCRATQAWRLEAEGMIPHPDDFYGLAATSELSVDLEAGKVSASGTPIPGMVLRSQPDAATGADLVISTDDGSMLFRARMLGGAIPFMLIDTYELYIGSCQQ